MEKIKIGDIVGRKSYNKDILFRVKNIIDTKVGPIAILIGIIERVEADSSISDLEKVSEERIQQDLNNIQKRIEGKIKQLDKIEALREKNVEIRADEQALPLMEGAVPVTEEDWGKEYLDYILSVKTVSDISEAIAHINRYNTKHSEAIITESYANAQRFLEEIDAAAVYVNASTRFTDGYEFGYGAEIGISTQKLHARGPMGLLALTTTRYIIYGNGQIRN